MQWGPEVVQDPIQECYVLELLLGDQWLGAVTSWKENVCGILTM